MCQLIFLAVELHKKLLRREWLQTKICLIYTKIIRASLEKWNVEIVCHENDEVHTVELIRALQQTDPIIL
jgi:hypothetical protein